MVPPGEQRQAVRMTRMFVAMLPPPDVVAHLDDFLEVRRDAAGFRWTGDDQFHVTLAFAASVPDHRLDDVEDALARTAGRHAPFGVRIAGGGAFPHPDAARVLWAGVAPDDSAQLDRIATSCRAALSRSGARVDGQRFHPHVTVARLGRPAGVTSWVRVLEAYDGPRWTVSQLALVASHLGEGARRRPRHEVVETFALGR